MSGPANSDMHIQIPKWSASDIEGFICATTLCEQCRSIFNPPKAPSGVAQRFLRIMWHQESEHHKSYDGLIRSVAAGCRICSMLKAAWDSHAPPGEAEEHCQEPPTASEGSLKNDQFCRVEYRNDCLYFFVGRSTQRAMAMVLLLETQERKRERPDPSFNLMVYRGSQIGLLVSMASIWLGEVYNKVVTSQRGLATQPSHCLINSPLLGFSRHFSLLHCPCK